MQAEAGQPNQTARTPSWIPKGRQDQPDVTYCRKTADSGLAPSPLRGEGGGEEFEGMPRSPSPFPSPVKGEGQGSTTSCACCERTVPLGVLWPADSHGSGSWRTWRWSQPVEQRAAPGCGGKPRRLGGRRSSRTVSSGSRGRARLGRAAGRASVPSCPFVPCRDPYVPFPVPSRASGPGPSCHGPGPCRA